MGAFWCGLEPACYITEFHFTISYFYYVVRSRMAGGVLAVVAKCPLANFVDPLRDG
jgi:hypothetical protein